MTRNDHENIDWFSKSGEKKLPLGKEERDQLLFDVLRQARSSLSNFPALDETGQPINDHGRAKTIFEVPGQRISPEAQRAAFNVAVANGAAVMFKAFERKSDLHGFNPDMVRGAAEEFKREAELAQDELKQLREVFETSGEKLNLGRVKIEEQVTQLFWRLVRLYAALVAISSACVNLLEDARHVLSTDETSLEMFRQGTESLRHHPVLESLLTIKDVWGRLINGNDGVIASERHIPFKQYARQYDVRWFEKSSFGFYLGMNIEEFPLAYFRDSNIDVGF